MEGLKSCGNDFLELAKVCRLSRGQTIRLVYIPGLLPQIKASISLISGLSWKAVVAAEVLSIPRYSLGYEMMNAKYYLETANLFGYIIIIVFLSLAFERIVKRWMGRLEWKPYINSKVERFLLGQKQNVKNGTNESADCSPPEVKIENLTNKCLPRSTCSCLPLASG